MLTLDYECLWFVLRNFLTLRKESRMLCCQLQKILKAQNLPVQSIRKTHKADTKPWGGGEHVILHLDILLRPRQKRNQVYPDSILRPGQSS